MMTDHTFSTTDLLSYFTGDLREEKRRAIEAHVASCASCRRFLVNLESEKSAFLADHPFDATVTLPKRQEPHRMLPFLRHQYYALAASLVLFVAAGYLYLASRPGTENRIKGDVGLKAFVQNSTGNIEKRRDRIYHTGEKIQFLYSCAVENRFVLLGIDTTGAITTYYPTAGDSSCTLERGADIPLPNSIVLDEYTGREAFLAVFSKKPLFVPEVKERLAALFARTRSIDSIDVKGNDAFAVNYVITVLPGGGR
jgi:hypothetical protein